MLLRPGDISLRALGALSMAGAGAYMVAQALCVRYGAYVRGGGKGDREVQLEKMVVGIEGTRAPGVIKAGGGGSWRG